MNNTIKVGFCAAYDWELLSHALPCVYDHADVIWISIDSDRKTWAGNKYVLDQSAFQNLVQRLDPKQKIKIYEDSFCVPELTSAENEVRQRNLLAGKMGEGGWHIQLDCDEYFLHFDRFVSYLHSIETKRYRFNVCCPLVTLFKHIDEGFLYIVPQTKERLEYIQIATRTPNYWHGRRNGDLNIYTCNLIIHQSWARSEEEIEQKIANWGHNRDFNHESFVQTWKKLNQFNFQNLTNFHPIEPTIWSGLKLAPSASIENLLLSFDFENFPQYRTRELIWKNSLFISRAKSLLKKLLGK